MSKRSFSNASGLFPAGVLMLILSAGLSAVDLPRAQPDQVGMSAERLQRVGAEIDRIVQSGELIGMTALIARRGKLVYQHTTGILDAETRTPLHHDSRLRIYSMTKPVTAVAAMMLVEEARLRLGVRALKSTLPAGSYSWGGAAGTFFWVDPVENIIAVFMTQRLNSPSWIRPTLQNLVYAAVED